MASLSDYRSKAKAAVNIENAKLLSVCVVSLFFIYHSIATGNNDHCLSIFTDGLATAGQSWQPSGCMAHSYSSKDIKSCMTVSAKQSLHNWLLFIGGTRTRQLFHEMLRLLSPSASAQLNENDQNERFTNSNLSLDVEFRWQPNVDKSLKEDIKKLADSDVSAVPGLIVVGPGSGGTGNAVDVKDVFLSNLTAVASQIERLSAVATVVWMAQEDAASGDEARLKKNEMVNLYNSAISKILGKTRGTILWSSNRLISQAYPPKRGNQLEASPTAVGHDAQVLLNFYCNHQLQLHDVTCCRAPEPVVWSQIAVCLFSAFLIVGAVVTAFSTSTSSSINDNEENITQQEPTWMASFCVAGARFALVMLYMFVCDRTDIFMKESKHWSLASFLVPTLTILALGLAFTKRLDGKNAGCLSRCQTEEWKGWMQLAILVYHYTGSSAIIPIYVIIRIMVSAYVFLNAYAHTSYYLSGRTSGLNRICQQLFRLNFLTFAMCLTMHRPYMFYYFVPLITFWFFAVYVTFAIPPRPAFTPVTDGNYSVLLRPLGNTLLRLLLLFSLIELVYYSETIFTWIFSFPPIKFLFVTADGSLHEWRFRWEVDRYSAISGCAFGLAVTYLRQRQLLPETDVSPYRSIYSICITASSAVALIGFAIWSTVCSNKFYCNALHPWIAGPVVLCYICLRNVPAALRRRYSTFFAWFGHISLELFLAQYHIWLALDTHGVLVLVPGSPVLNASITTFIFVCAAAELQSGTGRLAELLISKETPILLRNVIIFSALLLIAGNYHYITALL